MYCAPSQQFGCSEAGCACGRVTLVSYEVSSYGSKMHMIGYMPLVRFLDEMSWHECRRWVNCLSCHHRVKCMFANQAYTCPYLTGHRARWEDYCWEHRDAYSLQATFFCCPVCVQRDQCRCNLSNCRDSPRGIVLCLSDMCVFCFYQIMLGRCVMCLHY